MPYSTKWVQGDTTIISGLCWPKDKQIQTLESFNRRGRIIRSRSKSFRTLFWYTDFLGIKLILHASSGVKSSKALRFQPPVRCHIREFSWCQGSLKDRIKWYAYTFRYSHSTLFLRSTGLLLQHDANILHVHVRGTQLQKHDESQQPYYNHCREALHYCMRRREQLLKEGHINAIRMPWIGSDEG